MLLCGRMRTIRPEVLALAERLREYKARMALREELIQRGIIVQGKAKRRGRPPKPLAEPDESLLPSEEDELLINESEYGENIAGEVPGGDDRELAETGMG